MTAPINILLDGNGLQARAHVGDGKRLEALLHLWQVEMNGIVQISPAEPLNASILDGQDVVVFTTRKDTAYESGELTALTDFVRQGGGLLLMSNHGDVPGRYPLDMTKYDAILAASFGIEIENTFFANAQLSDSVTFSGPDLMASHPVIHGDSSTPPVASVVTINSCSLIAPHGAPLVRLNDQMIDYRNGYSHEGRCFAIALEGAEEHHGRVVVIADSGFIGSEGTSFPGPGLIGNGDNRRFLSNIVHWLGRII